MSGAHTPAPWFVSSSGHSVYALHGEPPRTRFSALPQAGRRDDASADELAANARLMAAAPDMLTALRRASLALAFAAESSAAMQDDYEAVSAAIAKATGANHA